MLTALAIALFAVGTPQHLTEFAAAHVSEKTQWQRCSWDKANDDSLAECARVLVPQDYLNPTGATMNLLVKRRLFEGTPKAQVWILHGGPGSSATQDMEKLSWQIYRDRPGVVFYAVDHRGVGGSERLGCPKEESPESPEGIKITDEEWATCIPDVKKRYGERLKYFTATASARDLASLMEKYRVPGVPVYVFGGSYGTYLAHRYLKIFPDQPSGVILEGIATHHPFTGYDRAMNLTTEQLMNECAKAPSCAGKFTDHPWEIAQRVVPSLDRGHCTQSGFATSSARAMLGGMSFHQRYRGLIPAIVSRLERCNKQDVEVLRHLKKAYGAASADERGQSTVLGFHVIASELFRQTVGPQALKEQLEGYTMATGLESTISAVQALWPTYNPDSYALRWASFNGPMLMLQGRLDPATTVARAHEVRRHFAGPHQNWVEFPQGAHNVTNQTPTSKGADCARSIYIQFLDNPKSDLNLGCIGDIKPLDWNGDPKWTLDLLGTRDAWGDGVASPLSEKKT